MNRTLLSLAAAFLLPLFTEAGSPSPRGPVAATWDEVFARMHPWSGTHENGSDPASLEGKILCGYQAWFSTPGDGSNVAASHERPGAGWVHYGDGYFQPGNCNIDRWPSMAEASPDESYPTPFLFADGSTATVFSSYNSQTVNRHFAWMAKYGIDGVFLQRFGSDLRNPGTYDFCDAALENVRNAANANGRTWAVMYDLSGLNGDEVSTIVMQDWRNLVDRMGLPKDPAYQRDHGKPLVAIWGVGFNDPRGYSLKDCAALVDFLKNDPHYGGNSVMLGVPYGWRGGIRDATSDPGLQELIKKADVVSPWSVTRYNSRAHFLEDVPQYQEPDLAWCRSNRLDYMPVIFPGFSWTNLQKSRGRDAAKDQIDREGGKFLWTQGAQLARLKPPAIYLAMFDELDEGTAIIKCSTTTPAGPSRFQAELDVPSDQYLWLAGEIGRALRHEIPITDALPQR